MQDKNLATSNYVISFMLSALFFLFIGASWAAASNLQTHSGDWEKKGYSIKGNWSVEQRGDTHVIVFDKKFKTKKGPDLKLFLSPTSIDDVTGATATEGSVFLAELKSHKGAQEYVIPANIDINDFASLLIHCEAYSHLWGGARL